VLDPVTKEIYIPGQDLPGHEPEQPAAPPPPDETPPAIPPKAKPKPGKAKARLESIAIRLAERVRRKEEKSGPVEPKFVAEVMNCTEQQAEAYCANRKSVTDEEARDALISLVIGADDDDE
jgi:hypothetical protein